MAVQAGATGQSAPFDFALGFDRRLLGTTQINMREFAWALVPAIALLLLWQLGKLLARRSARARSRPGT